jgi:hypothetical protein
VADNTHKLFKDRDWCCNCGSAVDPDNSEVYCSVCYDNKVQGCECKECERPLGDTDIVYCTDCYTTLKDSKNYDKLMVKYKELQNKYRVLQEEVGRQIFVGDLVKPLLEHDKLDETGGDN